MIFWQDIFKSLIPTFGLLQWVNMIKECLPKVWIILSELFLVSLLFVAVINPYSVIFKFSIFKYSSNKNKI